MPASTASGPSATCLKPSTPAITVAIGGPGGRTLYAGTLGANTPTGANWQTPQGVRNIAATIYAIDTLASGVKR